MHPKKGLGAVLSQKQDDRCYHPIVAFGSRTLTTSEQNYHSSKLEFLGVEVERYQTLQRIPRLMLPLLYCTDNKPSNIRLDNT